MVLSGRRRKTKRKTNAGLKPREINGFFEEVCLAAERLYTAGRRGNFN